MKARFYVNFNEDGSLALPVPFESELGDDGNPVSAQQIVYTDDNGDRRGSFTLERETDDGRAQVLIDTTEAVIETIKADAGCTLIETITENSSASA